MKKRIVKLAVMVSIIASVFTGTNKDNYNKVLADNAFNNVGGPIYATQGTSDEARICAIDAYSRIPDQIRREFERNGVIFLFNSSEDSSMPSDCAALCRYPEYVTTYDNETGIVLEVEENGRYEIEINPTKLVEESGLNLIHEMGHFTDYSYIGGFAATQKEFNASNTPEFTQIVNEEKDQLATIGKVSKYNVYNNSETFAEGFACFFIYPEKMMERCPKMSSYIQNVIMTYGEGGSTGNPAYYTDNTVWEEDYEEVPKIEEYDTTEDMEIPVITEEPEVQETVKEDVEEVKNDTQEIEKGKIVSKTESETGSASKNLTHEIEKGKIVPKTEPETGSASKNLTHEIEYNGYKMMATKEEAEKIAQKFKTKPYVNNFEDNRIELILIEEEAPVETLKWYEILWELIKRIFSK